MGNSKYTFDNCTTTDKRSNVFMLVPRDMYDEPCFPGDTLYDECDRKTRKEPFTVIAFKVYDDGDGIQECLFCSDGEWHYSDECCH